MGQTLRGADIVARSLKRLGCRRVFTLSGNHIMSIFDAALDAGLDLVHMRHEAAAVHMADAHGRLTGEAGIALVTGGPGHANAVGALFTALGAESPMVLLSGHAATWELGRGGFQEMRQAEMAAPVTKASWTAKRDRRRSAATSAKRSASRRSGRPGPVHLSLPSDLLDARIDDDAVVWPEPAVRRARAPLAAIAADADRCRHCAARSGRSSSPARRCRLSTGRALLASSKPQPARPRSSWKARAASPTPRSARFPI